VPQLLDAVLALMPLDTFVPQAALTMQVVDAPDSIPETVAECNAVLARHSERPSAALERFAFYERAAGAFAIVATGELRIYGNIILKKGVIAP
jgi:L-fucose mutarotase